LSGHLLNHVGEKFSKGDKTGVGGKNKSQETNLERGERTGLNGGRMSLLMGILVTKMVKVGGGGGNYPNNAKNTRKDRVKWGEVG